MKRKIIDKLQNFDCRVNERSMAKKVWNSSETEEVMGYIIDLGNRDGVVISRNVYGNGDIDSNLNFYLRVGGRCVYSQIRKDDTKKAFYHLRRDFYRYIRAITADLDKYGFSDDEEAIDFKKTLLAIKETIRG